tara:strand:+ start:1328 stop:1615 length:288 start_codon:yes stop_codon:yes gene_type:complete
MAGTLKVFTRTMAATDVITISGNQGFQFVSILCKTDNSGSNGITIRGTSSVGTTASNDIVLKADEAVTISCPDPYSIDSLTITAGTSSTAIVTAS